MEELDGISDTFVLRKENTEPLIQTAMTTLCSKIVNKYHRQFAKMVVGAIITVADVERKDVDFELKTVNEKIVDEKKVVRKSPLQRAAPTITMRWTVKGSLIMFMGLRRGTRSRSRSNTIISVLVDPTTK